MAEYYAVERSPEYLAHYGVKGMHWGVRRAMQRGNERAVARHLKRANKKLEKLNKKANIEYQKSQELKYDKIAKGYKTLGRIGLGAAVSGTGAQHLLSNVGMRKLSEKFHSDLDKVNGLKDKLYREAYDRDISFRKANPNPSFTKAMDHNKTLRERYYDPVKNADIKAREDYENGIMKNYQLQDIANNVRNIGAGVAIAGYGGYGINKLRAYKARKRQTVQGHKEAMAKRDAWKREMKKAFSDKAYEQYWKSKKRK